MVGSELMNALETSQKLTNILKDGNSLEQLLNNICWFRLVRISKFQNNNAPKGDKESSILSVTILLCNWVKAYFFADDCNSQAPALKVKTLKTFF